MQKDFQTCANIGSALSCLCHPKNRMWECEKKTQTKQTKKYSNGITVSCSAARYYQIT